MNPKQAGTSFGKKTAHKLDRIKEKPLYVILTPLTIYQEVLPSIISVVPITLGELFKTLCTVTVVTEFNDTLFKASGKTFEFIQADFNENICITDENSDEFKSQKEKKCKVPSRMVFRSAAPLPEDKQLQRSQLIFSD